MKRIQNVISFILFVLFAVSPAMAQVPRKAPAGDPLAATKQSLFLAEHGKCKEALQILKKIPQLGDKDLRLKASFDSRLAGIGADCAGFLSSP